MRLDQIGWQGAFGYAFPALPNPYMLPPFYAGYPPIPMPLPTVQVPHVFGLPSAPTSTTTKGSSQDESESTRLEDSDGSESATEPDSDLLAALVCSPGSGPFVMAELFRMRVDLRSHEFARCVLAKVDAENARFMAELVAGLGIAAPPPVVEGCESSSAKLPVNLAVWELCEEQLGQIASDKPPHSAHGVVLLVAELFARWALPISAMKKLFAALLFEYDRPADHAVNLACHAFLIAGPLLDRSPVGAQMVAYVVLKLKEVKGQNLSAPTRESITDVVVLQRAGWVPAFMGQKQERPSKKARAARHRQAGNPLVQTVNAERETVRS